MAFAGTLLVLALIDSTSFGTMLIPVWLLMTAGHVRVARMALYLATVALSYFAIGLLIMFGADAFLDRYEDVLKSTAVLVIQLIIGIALFALSFRIDSKEARARAAERERTGGGRLTRWRTRVMGESQATKTFSMALFWLAISAVAVEVASMLPYLAAIGIIATEGPSWPGNALILLAYCFVMIVPAVALTVGRIVADNKLRGPLARLEGWMTKNAAGATAWIVGIVGFVLAANAASDLWG